MGRSRRRRRRNKRKHSHRGFGSPGGNPNKKKKKVNKARQKLNKKIKSKTLNSKVKSVKKAVAKNKQKTKKKNRLKSIRSAVGDAVGKVKKGFSMGRDAYGKAFKSITKGAAAHASTTKKPKSKLKTQVSNFRNRVKQMSTPEAKKKRRADRLRRQHGLDYSRMNDSFKANVNVSQAYKHFGLDKYAPTRAVYNRLPKAVKNFSWKHQFKAPTKLGIRDGYRAPNRGGSDVVAGGIPGRRSAPHMRGLPRPIQRPMPIHGDPGPIRGLPPLPGRPPRGGPERDWLADFYDQYNIGSRGGSLDQEARDYWSKEAEAKGQDAVKRIIFNTAKAEGTLGGAFGDPERGMITNKYVGRHGGTHYEFEDGSRIRQRPRGRKRIDAGDGIPKAVPLPWFEGRFAGRSHGYPSKERRKAERKKRRAGPRGGLAALGIGIATRNLRGKGRGGPSFRGRGKKNLRSIRPDNPNGRSLTASKNLN